MERVHFIRCIYNLLQSQSASVRYAAAGTLVTLSTAPTAVKSAASVYIELIVTEADNNVKVGNIQICIIRSFLAHRSRSSCFAQTIVDK
jgi:hypothetical protein